MGPAGGNDFWETGVVRPDLILQDLVTIFHAVPHSGHKLDEDSPELFFYRRLPETTGKASSTP
jgi:iron complex transport system substrate-binding protein